MQPNKSPEPTAVGASVPLSRFTPRVGGGSAFYVRLRMQIGVSCFSPKDNASDVFLLNLLRKLVMLDYI